MRQLFDGARKEWPHLLVLWIGIVAYVWWDGVHLLDAINATVLAVFWGVAIPVGILQLLCLPWSHPDDR